MPSGDPVVLPAADLLLDRSGPVPLYVQLAAALERAVASDALPPGSRLENELSLSARLGLSRPTVRQAIQELVEQGLLVRRRGIGTQVVHGAVTRRIDLTSLFEDLERSGRTPTTRVLAAGPLAADSRVAEQLGVAPGTEVLRIRRLRLADGVPIAVVQNTLPPAFADLRADDLAEHGLYRLLRARGVVLRVARQRIGARTATAEERRLLELDRGTPLLTMRRTAFDATGAAVEYGDHGYRPDLYSFELTVVER